MGHGPYHKTTAVFDVVEFDKDPFSKVDMGKHGQEIGKSAGLGVAVISTFDVAGLSERGQTYWTWMMAHLVDWQ